MKSLSNNQFEYVLFHLKQHVDLNELELSYGEGNSDSDVCFEASEQPIDLTTKLNYNTEDIPILFPSSQNDDLYSIKNKQLIFHHDFLKSAFYLLSGQQEYENDKKDFAGRFPFKESIQYKLGIVNKPLVNYYFAIITDGLEVYCSRYNLSFKRKRLFESAGFLLSHDVDRVDYYHWRETVNRWMQLLGLKKAPYDRKRLLKASMDAILPTLFPGFKDDPFRNFKQMREMEKEHGIVSSWYFLNRDGSAHDARYLFRDDSIKKTMHYLAKDSCEIGLHGSLKSTESVDNMRHALSDLNKSFNYPVDGIRQHFLKFDHPNTFKIQESVGLKYDTSLGFAEHEGFRNSYCYPFKPFDFENDTMMDIWEFPLVVMDGTLFYYQTYSFGEAKQSVTALIAEIQKFGGIFTLLWHNSFFDEYEFPGITAFYRDLLVLVDEGNCKSITGQKLLQMLS